MFLVVVRGVVVAVVVVVGVVLVFGTVGIASITYFCIGLVDYG